MRALCSRLRIPALVLALGAPPCQETNPAFDRGDTGGTTQGVDASESGTSPITASSTSVDGDSTGPAPGSTGPEPGSTSSPTTGDPPGDGSSSTSGGPASGAYPACALDEDPPCPRPYDACYDFLLPAWSVCTQSCTDDRDCPQPDDGTAMPVCAGPSDDLCVLDCGGGARCPEGMSCQNIGANVRRCVWPT